MTPNCTTCGYAVEWLRNSFRSQFRLFRGSDVVTPGRWVRCPPGTPAYTGFHWFWSRDWIKQESVPWPDLGELPGPVRKYDSGQPPGLYPPSVLLGSADCIQSGETPGSVSPGIVDGFDARCWLEQALPPPPLRLRIDVTSPDHQLTLAGITQQLYVDPALGGVQLQQFLGPGAVVSVVPNTASPIPGTIIGRQGSVTVVVVSGTANAQQWALQPLTSLAGVTSFGPFGTLPFWWTAALAVQARIQAIGADPDGVIVLVGHSMGGAIAHILAGRYASGPADPAVQVLTFGSPQPGDDRLINLTRRYTQANFVNNDDPITGIPPSGGLLDWMTGLIPAPVRLRFADWRVPSQRVGLNPQGVRTTNPPTTEYFQLAYRAVALALAGQPIPAVTAHNMSEYLYRLGGVFPPGGDVLPGTILSYGGVTLPAGYLPCDGSLVSRAVYSDLFSAIGTTWGPGDGSTTFQLPDLRGRSPLGSGTGPGLSARAVGQTGGEEAHVLSKGELALHNHGVNDPGHSHGVTDPGHSHFPQTNTLAGPQANIQTTLGRPGASALAMPTTTATTGITATNSALAGVTTQDEGSNTAHNTMHPFAVVQVIIKT